MKWLHKDHLACLAVKAKLMGFFNLSSTKHSCTAGSKRAEKVSRSPQIQMVCSTVYPTLSQSIFSLLGLSQALYTENNVQKMSMRLRGRVKLKTSVI